MKTPQHVEMHFVNPEQFKKGNGGTKLLSELPDKTALIIADNEAYRNKDGDFSLYFHNNPDYYAGRTDSMHGVEFADMTTVEYDDSLSSHPVALKPYDNAWMAIRDYRTANKLNDICPSVTYQPIGFVSNNNKISGITRFEKGVTSFDSILWRERTPTEREVEWSLGCAAASLIFLHANHYAHGDFQVKNTAYDETLSSRVIDITTTRTRNDPSDFIADITLYAESLGQFGKNTSPVSADQMRTYFLDNYFDAIPDIYPKNKQQIAKEYLACVAVNLSEIIDGDYC